MTSQMAPLGLIDQISVAMTRNDLSGRYLQVNQPFCQFTEYSDQELLKLRFQDLIYAEDLQTWEDHHRHLCSRQVECFTLEHRLITRSGQIRWVSLTLSLIQPENGDPVTTLAIVQNITDRKPSEWRDRQPIQQHQLLHQITQQLNQDLIQQMEERTQQLQQTLRFKALLRRIVETVRESLSEDEILSVAVQELGEELQTLSCNTILFDDQMRSGRVTHNHVRAGISLLHHTFETSRYPELFQQILSGQPLQLCHLDLTPPRPQQTCLICPIVDDRGVIGGLGLSRPRDQIFTEAEVELVQQVALHCAIGWRQARLYGAAQQQVVELERLNLLRDDFLSTVSHELRTPLANIRMALHMFNLTPSEEKRQQYFAMAVNECARQTQLIEDLLHLQQLEAGQYVGQISSVNVRGSITTVVEAWIPRLQTREQQIQLQLPDVLPEISTDRIALERILRELIDNAHKHSASQAPLQVHVEEIEQGIQVQISNPGELPSLELPRLFDKFYRVPTADRWRQRGTGLGLALVQRLIEILEGQLWVQQDQGWVHFRIWIPRQI